MTTFRTRLTMTVIPVALLGVAATVVTGVATATRAQKDAAMAASTQLAAGTAGDVDAMGRTKLQSALSIAAFAEGYPGTDRDVLGAQVRMVAGRTPEVVDSYLVYEPGKAPGRDADWAGRPGNMATGRMLTVYLTQAGQDPDRAPGTVKTSLFAYDPKLFAQIEPLDWYQHPKATGQATTAEPYVDTGTSILMTSFTAPIRTRSGGFAGVGGVDVSLDAISHQIASTRVGRSGYAILVSAKGVVLGAPSGRGGSEGVIGAKTLLDVVPAARRDEISRALEAAVRAPGTVEGVDPFTGQSALISWARAASTGWTVLTVRPMAEIYAPVTTLRTTLIITGLLVALAIVGMVAFAAHRLTRPLPVLRSAALHLARGELEVSLPATGKDEMGELALAFTGMTEYLRAAAEHARGIAGGQLSQVIVPASPDDVLGHALETMRVDLAGTVRTVVENAGTLNASAEELGAQAEELRARASQTAEQSKAAAQGAAEFEQGLIRIADSTTASTRLADEASDAAAFMNAQLSQLSESSAAIEEVLRVITSIADQTQLLALNATIESARAGAVGKGFAVVADEVKQLAHSTTAATVRVSERVAAIQSAVATTVTSIGTITERVAGMGDLGRDIGSAVHQQAASSAQVGRSAAMVVGAAELTDRDVERTVAVSHTVASAAKRLQATIERFRL